MGLGGISIWQLLIILAIVIMLFGTKRLRTLGGDLGSAIKGFKKSMQDEDDNGTDGDADARDDKGTGEDGNLDAVRSSDGDDKRSS